MGADDHVIEMEEIDEASCWQLVARAGFGRIGVNHGDEVVILPVNVDVIDRRVVFRTKQGSILAEAGGGVAVAFECDHSDRMAESGWSVLVQGRLHDVTGTDEAAGWNELRVRPWAPGSQDRWMVVEPTAVSGRRIERRRVLPAPGS